MSEPAFRRMSVKEYLRTEERSPYKREYVGGFVYPLHGQAGASQEHSRITMNISATLYPSATRAGCRIHQAEMKLFDETSGSFYYPDVMLVCGPDVPDRYYETAPCLLAEVLSGSTASRDRVAKYTVYTAIPSLQVYLIVEQDERRVYAYTRENGKWELGELVGQGSVHIPCLGRAITLDEIYAGVR